MTGVPDTSRLAAIHQASFSNPRPWSEAEIAAILSSEGSFLLTESEGFLIGRVVADEAELLTLAVAPAARRRGLGAALLGEFVATARKHDAATAFLEVAADNPVAIALYRRQGFTEVGRRRGYYRDSGAAPIDAVVMSRPLIAETGRF